MAKKVYTIDVEDKNLKETTKAKKSRTVKSKVEKEIEKLGVTEINNASATKRVKNKIEKGFEKNVVAAEKKTVKQKVNEVEDYFDFSFRKDDSSNAANDKVLKLQAKDCADKISRVKEACKVDCLDAEAYVVMNLARIGSLFDCDKQMINA